MLILIRIQILIAIEFSEFKDVVFEDVVFDNNSSVTPYLVKYTYRIRHNLLLSNTTSSNTTSLNSEQTPNFPTNSIPTNIA